MTLALAAEVAEVVAVDMSPNMPAALAKEAAKRGVDKLHARRRTLRAFDLPAANVDIVVNCYALHHLGDADKAALVVRARR